MSPTFTRSRIFLPVSLVWDVTISFRVNACSQSTIKATGCIDQLLRSNGFLLTAFGDVAQPCACSNLPPSHRTYAAVGSSLYYGLVGRRSSARCCCGHKSLTSKFKWLVLVWLLLLCSYMWLVLLHDGVALCSCKAVCNVARNANEHRKPLGVSALWICRNVVGGNTTSLHWNKSEALDLKFSSLIHVFKPQKSHSTPAIPWCRATLCFELNPDFVALRYDV